MYKSVQQAGFSLLEFVLVIILLAVVMSIAVPQFLGIKEQAHSANVDAVAGGFSSAINMVRGQWELEARPNGELNNENTTYINYGGMIVGVDGQYGTPTSNQAEQLDTRALAMNREKCQQVFNAILQDAPSSTLSSNASVVKDVRFLVRYNAQQQQCIYYLSHSLDVENIPADGEQAPGTWGFSYFATTGKVHIFKS